MSTLKMLSPIQGELKLKPLLIFPGFREWVYALTINDNIFYG